MLQRVKHTGTPILITRFGEPVAALVPSTAKVSKTNWPGSMEGDAQAPGDMIGPALDADAWKVFEK